MLDPSAREEGGNGPAPDSQPDRDLQGQWPSACPLGVSQCSTAYSSPPKGDEFGNESRGEG